MNHPETLHRLARERQASFVQEARHDRLVRELTSTQRQEPRGRFSVRDLRWLLLRPASA
jgi:hypothetical protein